MLTLRDITKSYGEGENEVKALKGISIAFRKCEFVSVLGQSGCGKTTFLNIVGGLDRATSGELILSGESTDGFNDNDWDDYRNSKIGFVFQSYNLIPHLNVLSNVELALTISGIKSEERTERAKKALEKVGLSHKWNKRPNELSGGQMQRVAIARAIVNEPDILLADEPTGAIDSETSVQIMEILKEISATKLVIMVTHNADLAEEYSTRVVKFLDGEIVDDTDPYTPEEEPLCEPAAKKKKGKHKKGKTMSFFTAIKLSFKNLINKKGRSALTAVAGSVGIISIALILALNNGFNGYISDFERQSMSKYPITVSTGEGSVVSMLEEFLGGEVLDGDSINIDSMLDVITGDDTDREKYTDEEIVHIYGQFTKLFTAMKEKFSKTTEVSKFKKYVESDFDKSLAIVKYDYSVNMTIYNKSVTTDSNTGTDKTSYSLMNPLSQSTAGKALLKMFDGDDTVTEGIRTALDAFAFWDEIIADEETITTQYDVIKGSLPKNMNEVVLVLDEYNQISDFSAVALNEMNLASLILALTIPSTLDSYDKAFDEILTREYYVLPTSAEYVYDETTGLYTSVRSGSADVLNSVMDSKGIPVRISGIVRPKEGIKGGCINGVIGYTSELGSYIMEDANNSDIAVKYAEQYENYLSAAETVNEILAKRTENPDYQPTMEEIAATMTFKAGIKNLVTGESMDVSGYKNVMKELNARDYDNPSYIYFYPNRIANKKKIVKFIDDFISEQKAEEEAADKEAEEKGEEKSDVTYVIEYKDNLDSVVNELNSVVNTITYILVAVACVSVVVTMLLIAIIMYISVQDRTREIGIMRAIGARKTDISNIFNTETLLLGFASGVIGALIAFILQFPGNLLLSKINNMPGLLQMAWWHPLVLVGGAVIITVISGLIPAAMAAKKAPVVALRTE